MAGIGFQLKKIIAKESLSSFVEASITGAFVVAGPWLLSIINLSMISFIITQSTFEVINDFFAILVYVFCYSLILTGGLHYILTRVFSDYIYENKVEEAFYLISIYLLLLSIVLGAISILLSIHIDGVDFQLSLLIGLLTFSINSLWIILVFVSFLKWYLQILLSFIVGSIVSIVIITLKDITLHYIVLGYSIGTLITVLYLYLISYKNYKPKIVKSIRSIFISYWLEYKYLFFTGLFYFLSIWIDKILFWIYYGEVAGNIGLKLYFSYDISMYLANLSIIPGLIYFIINTETSYFIEVKKFLISLSICDYKVIVDRRNRIKFDSERWLVNQTQNQFILVLALSIISYFVINEFYILIIALWAVFFQLIIFSYISYLFYINRYLDTLISLIILFCVNTALFYSFHLLPIINIPGLSFLIATITTSIYIRNRFYYSINRLDRYIYR